MRQQIIFGTVLMVLLLTLGYGEARAQSDELPKFEVGGHYATLTVEDNRTEPGLGARLTYNVNKHLAFEAEGDLFPHNARSFAFRNGGRATEGLFGVKVGKRYQHFGIFAKARPGLISFTQGRFDYVPNHDGSSFPFDFRTERLTHAAFDVGGVLEFYPSRRIVTRFDAGDTIIRYGETTVNTITGTSGGTLTVSPITVPGATGHNFQFTAGVGFRF